MVKPFRPALSPAHHGRVHLQRRIAVTGVFIGLALVPLSTGAGAANGTAEAATGDPVLLAAGDVSRCEDPSGGEATATIIDRHPQASVAMLGDGVYRHGTLQEYSDCYGPSWGRFLDRTLPVPGNHDYDDPGAAGYFGYFGPRLRQISATAADSAKGYWSYDLGPWHVIGLNANCSGVDGGKDATPAGGCGAGSQQEQWLKADLAATRAQCMVVMWHHARFFSSAAGAGNTPSPSSDTKMSNIWRILQNAGADVVLSGHHHIYERFARMTPDGPDAAGSVDPGGMRQFVVGIGGGDSQTIVGAPPTGSEVRFDHVFGVLKLTLHETSYEWQFLASDGTVRDSGSDACRTDLPPTSTSPMTGSTPSTSGPPGPGSTTTAAGVVPPPANRSGYWMLGENGSIHPFGDARSLGDAAVDAEAADLEPTPTGNGYWIVDRLGNVHAFGDAPALGDLSTGGDDLDRDEAVTSLSATPSGRGYWLFTSQGRALPFGDAAFLGDVSALRLNGPVLDSIPTPTGRGYYMVASDGGIFSFGDALFRGSMGDRALNAPVQSLVPDPDGTGYWLVASDGGVFAFDADFRGSMGAAPLNRPVTGMVPFGDGYLMVSEDGGIFNFSDRAFHGSLGGTPPRHPIVSVAVLEP